MIFKNFIFRKLIVAPTMRIKSGASCTRGTRAGLTGYILDENTRSGRTAPSDTESGVWCAYPEDLNVSDTAEIYLAGRNANSIAAFQAEYDADGKMTSIKNCSSHHMLMANGRVSGWM